MGVKVNVAKQADDVVTMTGICNAGPIFKYHLATAFIPLTAPDIA